MILGIPQKEKPASDCAELKWKIIESVAIRILRKRRCGSDFNRVLGITEFENANDILILFQDAIQLCNTTAVSRNRDIAVKIEPNCSRFCRSDALQQFGKKIVGDWEIILGDIVLRYFYDADAWIRGRCTRSPEKKFVVCQKFRRLKQSQLASASHEGEHANAEHEARHPRVAKCSSEPRHQTAYSQLPIMR